MTFNSFVIAWATHTGWGKLIGLFLRHQREQSGNTPLRLPNGPVNGGGKMCQMAA